MPNVWTPGFWDAIWFDTAKSEYVDAHNRAVRLKLGGATSTQIKWFPVAQDPAFANKETGSRTLLGWTMNVASVGGATPFSHYIFSGTSFGGMNSVAADKMSHPLVATRAETQDLETLYFTFKYPGNLYAKYGFFNAAGTKMVLFELRASTTTPRVNVNDAVAQDFTISPAFVAGTTYYGGLSYDQASGNVTATIWSDAYNGTVIGTVTMSRATQTWSLTEIRMGHWLGSSPNTFITDITCANLAFQCYDATSPTSYTMQDAGVAGASWNLANAHVENHGAAGSVLVKYFVSDTLYDVTNAGNRATIDAGLNGSWLNEAGLQAIGTVTGRWLYIVYELVSDGTQRPEFGQYAAIDGASATPGGAPTAPGLKWADAGNGAGGTLTVYGSDAGTSNQSYYSPDGKNWTAISAPITGDGAIALVLSVGDYYFVVTSTLGGVTISNVVHGRVTGARVGGPASNLIAKFAKSGVLQSQDLNTMAWATVKTLDVWIQPVKGNKTISHDRREIDVSHRGFCNEDPTANEGYRLVWEGRNFLVVGTHCPLEGGYFWVLDLVEHV